MSLIAFGDTILVEEFNEERKTNGGILLPKDIETQDVSKISRVVSVAEAAMVKMKNMGVRPLQAGDLVYHRYFAGTDLYKDNDVRDKPDFKSLKLEEILAVDYKN